MMKIVLVAAFLAVFLIVTKAEIPTKKKMNLVDVKKAPAELQETLKELHGIQPAMLAKKKNRDKILGKFKRMKDGERSRKMRKLVGKMKHLVHKKRHLKHQNDGKIEKIHHELKALWKRMRHLKKLEKRKQKHKRHHLKKDIKKREKRRKAKRHERREQSPKGVH